jgi:RNA processing factor Prp31
MSSNHKIDRNKQKKEIIEELDFYKSLILKKIDLDDFNSALIKIESALTLLEEYQTDFNFEKETKEFTQLQQKLLADFDEHRKLFGIKLNNLRKETLTEANLENFIKLLAMLKNEVDNNLNQYNLHDLRDDINTYFTYIKKLYTIISSYKVLNYSDASGKMLTFMKESRSLNFPNLKELVTNIYQNLLLIQFESMAKNYEKLSINEISEKLSISPDKIEDIINLLINKSKSPIKKYTQYNREVIFNK